MPDEPAPPASVPYGPSSADLDALLAIEKRAERRLWGRRVVAIALSLLVLGCTAVVLVPAFVAYRFQSRREFLNAFEALDQRERCCRDEQLELCMASVRELIGHARAAQRERPLAWISEQVDAISPIHPGASPDPELRALVENCPTARYRAESGRRR